MWTCSEGEKSCPPLGTDSLPGKIGGRINVDIITIIKVNIITIINVDIITIINIDTITIINVDIIIIINIDTITIIKVDIITTRNVDSSFNNNTDDSIILVPMYYILLLHHLDLNTIFANSMSFMSKLVLKEC